MKKSQKEQKINSNPLRTQPDYGERELYDDIIHISNIVNDLYKKQLNEKYTEYSSKRLKCK